MIGVLVVDDQELVREGFALVLEAQPDIAVLGRAADGVEAIALARRHRPDVVLMDVQMPRMDGLEATRQIIRDLPACRVLVLTTYDLDDYVLEALRVGASGFLLKDTPRKALFGSVRAAAEGDVLLDARTTRRLVDERLRAVGADDAARRALAGLTPREREVLLAVADGLSNVEVGARLGMSEATVKTHVSRLLDKLAARDRVQLVVFAYRSGIVR